MDFKLILKKIENELSEKENVIFENWYQDSKAHRDYYKKVRKYIFENKTEVKTQKDWKKLRKKLHKKPKTTYWKYTAVASIALLLLTGIYLSNNSADALVPESTVKAGTNKAILTLANGSDVLLNNGMSYVNHMAQTDGANLVYHRKENPTKENKTVYNVLTVPRGGQYCLTLSDSTKIWLNSDSKIKYPVCFIKGQTRRVQMIYGEAYFQVSPSERHKGTHFKVLTKGQEIEVLGTEFNVNAYSNKVIKSTLVKGRIKLQVENKTMRVNPNEQVTFNLSNHQLNVQKINVYNEIAWKKGIFSFKNKSLEDIMKVLSRWYDVHVNFRDNRLKKLKFNGVLSKKQSINAILSIIAKPNNIYYEIKNHTITIK